MVNAISTAHHWNGVWMECDMSSADTSPHLPCRDLRFTWTACLNYHTIKQKNDLASPPVKEEEKNETTKGHEDALWTLTEIFSTVLLMLHIVAISRGFPYTGIEFYLRKAVKICQDGDLSRYITKGGWEKGGGLTYSWKCELELVVVTKRRAHGC